MITVTTLETICRQAVVTQPAGEGGFQPKSNQVFFFMLVWLQKKKMLVAQDGQRLADIDEAALHERVALVVEHLAEWGRTVSQLKENDERNWDLLYIQLKKAVRYFDCAQADKDDAVQETLLKIMRLLRKMVPWPDLERRNIVDLVVEQKDNLTNIYDFGSPFYFFAQRIAKTELIMRLRGAGRTTPLDGDYDQHAAPKEYGNEVAAWSEATRSLQMQLTSLLTIIQQDLTSKQRLVITSTLGGRPQFREALLATGLPAPADIPLKAGFMTDDEIAADIGTATNNVRVHRNAGKKRVAKINIYAGQLLENLMSQRGRSQYVKRAS